MKRRELKRRELTASDLAVVIPTRGRIDKLRATLAALAGQTESGFETVVVFDGRDQDIPRLPGVTLLQQDHAGPGVARNLGVGATSRPLVLFIGDDMVPRPDCIARHLDQHRKARNRDVAVVGRVVWHHLVPQDRLHRWLSWSNALYDFPEVVDRADEDPGWGRFYSCNASLPQEVFSATGGFDSDFVFDYEDLDFAWRLHQMGFGLVYEPRAVVEHAHAYDWAGVVRRYESRAGAERLMAVKHPWFRPHFRDQLVAAQCEPRSSRGWALVVDYIPRRTTRVHARVRRRADLHYLQKLAPAFLAAWDQASTARRD